MRGWRALRRCCASTAEHESASSADAHGAPAADGFVARARWTGHRTVCGHLWGLGPGSRVSSAHGHDIDNRTPGESSFNGVRSQWRIITNGGVMLFNGNGA